MESNTQQSDAAFCVLSIKQFPDHIALSREYHRWNAPDPQRESLGELTKEQFKHTALDSALHESLAHLNNIDAIAYDCTNTDVDMFWDSVRTMLRVVRQVSTKKVVSVVFCLNPLDVSANAVETSLRLDSVPHAVAGIRVNIVYATPSDRITDLPMVQYLLHPQSRYITGCVIDVYGKILLGGMLNAERVLAVRATHL